MNLFWLRLAISLISIGVIITRLIWPNLNIDYMTLGLLIIAVLPWLTSIIESAEFPGGWKIKFRDIEEAARIAENIPIEPKEKEEKESLSYLDISEQDPNLAMVALRIEIEKKVRELSRKYQIQEQQSLRRMLDQLLKKNVLEYTTINGLNELIAAGNRAAHGAKVDPDVAFWAFRNANKLLYFLDRKIDELV